MKTLKKALAVLMVTTCLIVPATASTTTTVHAKQYVYITPTGKCYHSIPRCGRTKSSSKVSLSYAKKYGYRACSKCH